MTFVITAIVLVSLAVVLLHLWGRRSYKHRRIPLADLERFFDTLLTRGFNGGFMIIEIPKTPMFLQFSKYILDGGIIGMQFDFPVAKWSEVYYEKLKQQLEEDGLEYSSTRLPGREVREFLTVDVKQDVTGAATLARNVVRSVFELSEKSLVTIYFSNCSPKLETITR